MVLLNIIKITLLISFISLVYLFCSQLFINEASAFFFAGIETNQINFVDKGIDICRALFCSSENKKRGSSPDSTPCPSPVKSAFNSSIELLPVRPSGVLANLFDQIMTHHGFTAHGEFSLFPSLQDSLRSQGMPKSSINAITSYELMGHKYVYNYKEVCHKLSMYDSQERLDFLEANNHWFTHKRNFYLTDFLFKTWYTVNIDNISKGNTINK